MRILVGEDMIMRARFDPGGLDKVGYEYSRPSF